MPRFFQVVYFTATFPYFILIALLVNGVLLDGAVEGLKFLFIPDWNKMADFTVWRKAAEQMFFSLGISWGGLVMFGSYNKFHNKVWSTAAVLRVFSALVMPVALWQNYFLGGWGYRIGCFPTVDV